LPECQHCWRDFDGQGNCCPACQDGIYQHSYRLPRIFWGATWDDFTVKQDIPSRERCRQYADTWPHTTGLILYGGVGSGKSLCAACILKQVGGLWVNVADMLATSKDSWNDPRVEAYFDKAMDAPLLVLDDLGAERYSVWAEEELYRLFNRHAENQSPVIITTNLDASKLRDRLGDRSISRLASLTTEVVWFKGSDFRVAHGNKHLRTRSKL
jgi:DNA replication protein DnaC